MIWLKELLVSLSNTDAFQTLNHSKIGKYLKKLIAFIEQTQNGTNDFFKYSNSLSANI